MAKKRGNPGYVTNAACRARYGKVDMKMTEILHTLTGNPKDHNDLGLVGDVRDIKRDRKWIYALITLIGVPTMFLLIKYLLGV